MNKVSIVEHVHAVRLDHIRPNSAVLKCEVLWVDLIEQVRELLDVLVELRSSIVYVDSCNSSHKYMPCVPPAQRSSD
jgi:hypothetical protein